MTSLFDTITRKKQQDLVLDMHKRLIQKEAELGGRLFPIDNEDILRREFFCLDENTWVWHEEVRDENGDKHIYNTRYEVGPGRVLKSTNGQGQQSLGLQEAEHLLKAVRLYRERVLKQLYPNHDW
ncbi:MAG: hypothetical protein AAF413_01220 [Patescibacteria group bacterium]